MATLTALLKQRLAKATRIAVLGIGSELRGDDVAGMLVAECLDRAVSRLPHQEKLRVFIGSTAPENVTGEIKRFNPSHLIIVDTADIGKDPGAAAVVELAATTGISFSTHRLPSKIIAAYLSQSLACDIFVVGIQPKTCAFGLSPSPEVAASVAQVASAIMAAL